MLSLANTWYFQPQQKNWSILKLAFAKGGRFKELNTAGSQERALHWNWGDKKHAEKEEASALLNC